IKKYRFKHTHLAVLCHTLFLELLDDAYSYFLILLDRLQRMQSFLSGPSHNTMTILVAIVPFWTASEAVYTILIHCVSYFLTPAYTWVHFRCVQRAFSKTIHPWYHHR